MCFLSTANEIIDPVTKANSLAETDRNSFGKNVAGSEILSSAGFCACHYRQSGCKQTFRRWFSLSFQFEEKVAAISIAFLDFVSFFLARCSTFRAATRHYLNYQHKKRFVHETAGLNTTKKTSKTARTGCRSAIKFIAKWINFYGHFSVVVEKPPWGMELLAKRHQDGGRKELRGEMWLQNSKIIAESASTPPPRTRNPSNTSSQLSSTARKINHPDLSPGKSNSSVIRLAFSRLECLFLPLCYLQILALILFPLLFTFAFPLPGQ